MAVGQTNIPHTLPNLKSVKTVGLISDTHVPARAAAIPEAVFKVFENVDYIIHAGDLVDLSVIDELEQIAPVLAVRGNMDPSQVSGVLPDVNLLKVMDWKIGVTHDPGSLYDLNKLREIVKQNFLHVIVYGHTHTSSITWEDKTLFINPGSPTAPEPPFLCKPTVGLLKITRDAITPEIVHL
jgi:putative phosphoesterase